MLSALIARASNRDDHLGDIIQTFDAALEKSCRKEPLYADSPGVRPPRGHDGACISRSSQAFASFQSRITVSTDTSSTEADSSTLRPPKNRISTTRLLRSSIYARIGIALVLAEQLEGAAAPDAMHLTVVMVSGGGIERLMKINPSLPASVLGVAPDHTGHVYLFWDRIVARARRANVRVDRVVGRVLAHEIGHHLLPARGHSDAGLMRASLNYQTSEPPSFTHDQVDSMRALLIAAN